MTMPDYFGDLQFLSSNRMPHCTAWVDGVLDHYALNLAWDNHLFFECRNGDMLRLDAPVVWWTLPGRHYRYGCCDGTPWDQSWIAFKGERAQRFVETGLLPDRDPPVAQPLDSRGYMDAFERVLWLLWDHGSPRSRVVHELEGLLLRVADPEAYPPAAAQHRPDDLAYLAQRVRERPERRWDFHKEADALGMSYSRLRQAFKTAMQRAPQSYLIECRLGKAAALLRDQNQRVNSVASRVGFDDPSYFARQFRRRFGVTPRAYMTSFRYPGTA